MGVDACSGSGGDLSPKAAAAGIMGTSGVVFPLELPLLVLNRNLGVRGVKSNGVVIMFHHPRDL